jgi:hypothetical protein
MVFTPFVCAIQVARQSARHPVSETPVQSRQQATFPPHAEQRRAASEPTQLVRQEIVAIGCTPGVDVDDAAVAY